MNAAQLLLLAGLAGVGSAVGIHAPRGAAELAGPRPTSLAAVPLEEAMIYWEYNSSGNDLGVHVFLDGEDWKSLRITNSEDRLLFVVSGFGPYKALGMTELFFEGAEPSLDEVPLNKLLAAFPEGVYEFEGRTVDDAVIRGESEFSHAIPDGPDVTATVGPGNLLEISWTAVTGPPPGFPNLPINIVGYQVLVEEDFQVTVPSSVLSLTVPPEYVGALAPGKHEFEVLAIDESGNQTITEGSFRL
ncbi:MAG: hypothetical protein EYC70_07155 [Planctomycetota bacterium]|nr:MAG: hypothetical protein EYC70_07155 [Planctomycetota bacterium]